MKRFDLRHLKQDFLPRMKELAAADLASGEVGIFIFEIGDFSGVQASADLVGQMGYELLNSLKYNETDWTIVLRKLA